jgi:hypothetical protein
MHRKLDARQAIRRHRLAAVEPLRNAGPMKLVRHAEHRRHIARQIDDQRAGARRPAQHNGER